MIRQEAKNPALTSIPEGTAHKACSKAMELSLANKKPTEAGTMVVGIDPKTPPSRPPSRSIATVAAIATKAAKIPDTIGPIMILSKVS